MIDIILVTLVFLVFDHYRRRATSREIAEALGSRDSLIETLRNEIKDRFAEVDDRAQRAVLTATTAMVQADATVESMKAAETGIDEDLGTIVANVNAALAKVPNVSTILKTHRLALDAFTTGQQNLHKITDSLNTRVNTLFQQSDTNDKVSQGLRRDINHCLERLGKVSKALEHPMPPLGAASKIISPDGKTFTFPKPPQPPHCYDGPTS